MSGSFEELDVYQEARRLRRRVYKLTRLLPNEEKFNLVNQMRRAALSLTNNIAEGNGSRSWRHNISYLYRSRGSLNELIDDFNACDDETYFKSEHIAELKAHAERVRMLINGYVRHLRQRLTTAEE